MPGSRAHIGRAPGVAVWLVLLLVSVGPASAREADDAGAGAGAPAPLGDHDSDFHRSRHPWVTVAWLTGSTQLDPQLADYQWDTSPRLSWGAQASLGVEQLHQRIGELRAEEAANERLEIGRQRRGGIHRRSVAQDVGYGEERGVEIVVQMPAQERVRGAADQDQDRGDHARVPERQPGPDRERPHGSSFST